MGLFDGIFNRNGSGQSTGELPDIFPLPIANGEFVKLDVIQTYTKILTDTLERTKGIKDEFQHLFWDNCLQSEVSDGLVTLLAKAMEAKSDLFLVYDKVTGVLRRAKPEEATQIKLDYETQASSKLGIYVSFAQYRRTDMIKLYSALEHCTVSALNKSMRLSSAVQYKINDLRASVSLADADKAEEQARKVAKSLSLGKDVYLDAKDVIEMLMPNLEATKASMDLMDAKRSYYLGLPLCYINGDSDASKLSDTGNSDAKAIDRGLKGYFFSIIKPVVEALFGIKVRFQTQDLSQLEPALDALKTFELVPDQVALTPEEQAQIVRGLLGLPELDKPIVPKPQPAPAAAPNTQVSNAVPVKK